MIVTFVKHTLHAIFEDLKTGELDDYAFAPEREDLKSQHVEEPDNEVEQRLLLALERYVIGNVPLDEWSCGKISEFRKKGLYKDIFADIPEDVSELYRAVVFSTDKLEILLGSIHAEHVRQRKNNGGGTLADRFIWKPRPGKPASGWSLKPNLAQGIVMASMLDRDEGEQYMLTMTAPVGEIDKSQCFSLIDGLYKVDEIDRFEHERETLTFGPIVVTEIQWFPL